MGTVLNSLFGKGKGNYGDVEYWHGAERAGWLMKQGKQLVDPFRSLPSVMQNLEGAATQGLLLSESLHERLV